MTPEEKMIEIHSAICDCHHGKCWTANKLLDLQKLVRLEDAAIARKGIDPEFIAIQIEQKIVA